VHLPFDTNDFLLKKDYAQNPTNIYKLFLPSAMRNFTPLSNIIKPDNQPIISKGKVMYYERFRARCLILLKKEIRQAFGSLQDRNSPIDYSIEYYHTKEDLKRRVQAVLDGGTGLPFLLFLSKNE